MQSVSHTLTDCWLWCKLGLMSMSRAIECISKTTSYFSICSGMNWIVILVGIILCVTRAFVFVWVWQTFPSYKALSGLAMVRASIILNQDCSAGSDLVEKIWRNENIAPHARESWILNFLQLPNLNSSFRHSWKIWVLLYIFRICT